MQFAAHNYRSLYLLGNLNYISVFGLVTLFLWFLAYIKKLLIEKFSHRRSVTFSFRKPFLHFDHETFMHNFTMRFIYESYFEFVLCSLISVSSLKSGSS